MTEQRKAVIKNADMSEEMQQDAVDIASQALAKYNIEKVSRFLYFYHKKEVSRRQQRSEKKRLKRNLTQQQSLSTFLSLSFYRVLLCVVGCCRLH